MTKNRASVFDTADDLDVSGFEPQSAAAPTASKEQVRAVAEASNFRSREAAPVAAEPAKRKPRRHKTGRTAQFNVRIRPETFEAFYKIADEQTWLVGETVERALAALQRELAGQK